MSKFLIEKRYIEVVGVYTTAHIDLSLRDVFRIGKFTRENVHYWLAAYGWGNGEDYSVDFHAVCGEQDIPWVTEEARDCYQRSESVPSKEALAHRLHLTRMITLTHWMVVIGYVSLAIIIVKYIWP